MNIIVLREYLLILSRSLLDFSLKFETTRISAIKFSNSRFRLNVDFDEMKDDKEHIYIARAHYIALNTTWNHL